MKSRINVIQGALGDFVIDTSFSKAENAILADNDMGMNQEGKTVKFAGAYKKIMENRKQKEKNGNVVLPYDGEVEILIEKLSQKTSNEMEK